MVWRGILRGKSGLGRFSVLDPAFRGYGGCFGPADRLAETSARQVIELTLYFISHFSVDENRIYAASIPREGKPCPRQYLCGRIYMQPIFTELLNGTENTPLIAENGVAVYVFMAENDEYCGSQRARDACENLRGAYIDAGWNENEIDDIL